MSDNHLSPSHRGQSDAPKSLRGAPDTHRIGVKAYETLMGLLAEEPESPTSPLGVFVANSTKRALRRQIEATIKP